MTAVTLHRDGRALTECKPFTWSYSKLKNYETCPMRHQELDLKQAWKQDDTTALDWGDRVHKCAAAYLGKGEELPGDVLDMLEPWTDRIKGTPGTILVERKYALKRDLSPCGYFDKGVWFRGVADVLKLADDVALAVDWKTGKIQADSVQLALMAACVFAHHPEVMKMRTEFIWLQHDATTREDFARTDLPKIWSELFPRVDRLESSYNSGTYEPKPNKLCAAYCPVATCIHYGKRYSNPAT